MAFIVSADRIRIFLNRFRDRLWVRPLAVCLLSIVAAFIAKRTDDTGFAQSEIARRALSPAVNDPGTAIDVVGTLLRLFVLWNEPASAADDDALKFDRVEVPEIAVRDMFDDAFTAIARDGAGMVEVAIRLQKALHSLATIGDAECALSPSTTGGWR